MNPMVGFNLALTPGSALELLWGVQLSPYTSVDDFHCQHIPTTSLVGIEVEIYS